MSAAVRLLAHPHTPGGLRAAAPYKLWANSASLSNALGWLFSSIGKLILSHGLQASQASIDAIGLRGAEGALH